MITFDGAFAATLASGCLTLAMAAWSVWRERAFLRLKALAESLQHRSGWLEGELGVARADLQNQRETNQTLQASLRDNISVLMATRNDLQSQFQSLSSQALVTTQKAFLDNLEPLLSRIQDTASGNLQAHTATVNALLAPLTQNLQDMQTHIQALESARAGAYEGMKTQLQTLAGGHQSLQTQTQALITALRAPHVRGCWGEMQLKRVVELAGMVAHCDFYEQEMLGNLQGSTHKQAGVKPDLIVRIPGGKSIIVDAKTPLMHYLETLSGLTPDQHAKALKSHSRALAQHIKALSDKRYWAFLPGAVEFTVLFLPGDPFLSAALEADPSLLENAAQKNIILATPMVLIALLKTIAQGWRQEILSQQTQRVLNLAKDLGQHMVKLQSLLTALGRGVRQSQSAYQDLSGLLETRLLPTTNQLQGLCAPADDSGLDAVPQISPGLFEDDLPTAALSA
jgi:DNA recombination protein RmuC